MSWLSDLAGKAENILNTIDNSAAQALNTPNESYQPKNVRKKEPYLEKDFIDTPNITSNNSLKSNNRSDTDLFKFQSSVKLSGLLSDANSDKASSGYRTNNDEYESNQTQVNYEISDDRSGNDFQVENKLLRSEVSSLNQEISSLLQRSHRTEEECKKLRNQTDKLTSQLRESDKKYRQLVSENDDIEERSKTKDSKIEALSVEIKKIQTNYSNDKSGFEQNLIEESRNKITSLEEEIKNRDNSLEKIENEKMRLQSSLEDANMRLAQALNNSSKLQSSDKRRIESLSNQLETSKNNFELLQKEFKEYKEKAVKILQNKEKLISNLRTGNKDSSSSSMNNGSTSGISADYLQSQLTEAYGEIERLREEISRCRIDLENREFDMQELEQQLHAETETLRKNSDLLEEHLERERQMREDIEIDYRQLTKDNRQLQERHDREVADLRALITDLEHQQQKNSDKISLNNQFSNESSPMMTNHQVEVLESRVRSLQDALMQRQSALEATRAELHSLTVVQADREQKSATASASGYNEERRKVHQDFVTISLTDAQTTKNCKSAINTVDRMGLKLAILFRSYPPARLFFMFYSLLLHIWLVFIFFTYQPETHGSMNQPGGAK